MPMRVAEPAKPRYPASDLFAIVNPDIRKPFDMSEALLRIVDDSRLLKFKPSFGRNLVTTWAHIHGKETQSWTILLNTRKRNESGLTNTTRLPSRHRGKPDAGD